MYCKLHDDTYITRFRCVYASASLAPTWHFSRLQTKSVKK